jgi:hypothetical protein
MPFRRLLVLAGLSLSAACTANTQDANVGEDTAAYKSSTHSIHYCMTAASRDESAPLITWASVGVSTRPTGLFLAASVDLNLTDAETASLREANPFTFTGGVSVESGALKPGSSAGSSHFESADGSMTFDMDLNQPHGLDHGVVSPGRGTATVKIDFAAAKRPIPDRIRALGTKTVQFTLADCF